MEVSGEMGLAESCAAASELRARLLGWRRWTSLAIYLALVILVYGLISVIVELILPAKRYGGLTATVTIAAIIAAAYVMMRVYIRLSARTLAKAMIARGSVDPMRVTFGLEPGSFHMETDSGEIRVRWPAVSEIACTRTQWIFMTGSLGYVVPRRLFADLAAERAFVGAALERLTDPARARSAKARAFIAA